MTLEDLYKTNAVFAEAMKDVPEDRKEQVEKEMLRLAQWFESLVPVSKKSDT